MVERVERLRRVARGWDEAAAGYEQYFVPRFRPWVELAVAAVNEVPDGPVLVPCCGTFPELELLLERFPDREIAGIDLSAGMVSLARDRAAGLDQVTVVEGDASELDPRWTGACGAVVSVFGLQQLPEPEHAIGSWYRALRPGGQLSVVYWPSATEEAGPFRLIGDLVDPGPADPEPDVVAALRALGAAVDRDEEATFPMAHPDAPAFFEAFTRFGPLRATAIVRGEPFVDELRERFLDRAPAGEWVHHPRARVITATRPGR